MYQVIARKYRPAQFSELISQEHVRTTLENAIRNRRIAHGYILSGQRGTGKTTVARIIARCLNCVQGPTPEPCGVCSSCVEISNGSSPDVIEIDAASNRGINEMRELRENVRYRPSRDKYKVFIIDEAHQITSEAFNALLKTLEEPPEWVVFILCTTESHKIPVTIASRCQQFSFRSVDFGELVERMRWICEQEGISADDEVLGIIAQAGEGSVRDSLSALDQAIACCGTTLGSAEVRQLLGMFSLESMREVTDALLDGDGSRMLKVVFELERNGRSLHHFCRELARYLRNLLVIKVTGKPTEMVGASIPEQQRLLETASRFSEEDLSRYLALTLELYKELQFSLQPRLHVEMGLLRLLHAGRLLPIEEALGMVKGQGGGGTVGPPAPPKPSFAQPVIPKASAPVSDTSSVVQSKTPVAAVPAPVFAAASPVSAGDTDLRSKLVNSLHEERSTFAADTVSHCEVTLTGGDLVFVAAPADADALGFAENDVQKAAQAVLGRAIRIKIVAGTPAAAPAKVEAPSQSNQDQELMDRALADPAVQEFQRAFPGSEIRQVRNLKD
jgi:DNA polymerase-3 subunit gamma/tau